MCSDPRRGGRQATVPRSGILTTSLASARVGDPYVAAFDASGGDESTYQWTLSGLPPGMEDKGDGAFGGTPTGPGAALVKATVIASLKDGIRTTATKRLQLTIADKSNAINPDIAEARAMAHAIARRACGALAGFLMTKLGKKNEEGEAQEDRERGGRRQGRDWPRLYEPRSRRIHSRWRS